MIHARRGFTLIELLVVIAIIGILSAVVLAALNTARNKGNDAGVKSSLTSTRAQAELFYDANSNQYALTPGSADDVCSPTGQIGNVKSIYAQVSAAASAVGVPLSTSLATLTSSSQAACHACPASGYACNPKNAWAAEAPLKSGGFFCVDNTGYAATTTLNLANGDASCLQLSDSDASPSAPCSPASPES